MNAHNFNSLWFRLKSINFIIAWVNFFIYPSIELTETIKISHYIILRFRKYKGNAPLHPRQGLFVSCELFALLNSGRVRERDLASFELIIARTRTKAVIPAIWTRSSRHGFTDLGKMRGLPLVQQPARKVDQAYFRSIRYGKFTERVFDLPVRVK